MAEQNALTEQQVGLLEIIKNNPRVGLMSGMLDGKQVGIVVHTLPVVGEDVVVPLAIIVDEEFLRQYDGKIADAAGKLLWQEKPDNA